MPVSPVFGKTTQHLACVVLDLFDDAAAAATDAASANGIAAADGEAAGDFDADAAHIDVAGADYDLDSSADVDDSHVESLQGKPGAALHLM